MRKLIFLMLLLPLLAVSQNSTEYMVFENGLITANPAQLKQFETGMAAHNKKYHGDGMYGARVYTIGNGPHTGSYMWIMGPLPWSAMDSRPALQGHDEDWNTNVLPYMLPEGDQTYWKYEAEMSHFPKDFTIKNLLVDIYDVKRFKSKEAMALVGKIKKVMMEKFPEETFGIYTNQFPSTKEGRDLSYISFYDKSSWLGEDNDFLNKYEQVHGKGSFATFLKDWEAVTDGAESEIWTFRPDLSGISGEIKAVERK